MEFRALCKNWFTAQHLAHVAQIVLVVFAIVGYFLTVRPVYRLERAEEDLAKRASDMERINRNILQQEATLARLTYLESLSKQRETALSFRLEDLGAEQISLQSEHSKLQQQNAVVRNENAMLQRQAASARRTNEELQQLNAEIRRSYESQLSMEKARDNQLAQFGRYARDCIAHRAWEKPQSVLISCVSSDAIGALGEQDRELARAWTAKQVGQVDESLNTASDQEIEAIALQFDRVSEIADNCEPIPITPESLETSVAVKYRKVPNYIPCSARKNIAARLAEVMSFSNTTSRALSVIETAVALRLDPSFAIPGQPRPPQSISVE